MSEQTIESSAEATPEVKTCSLTDEFKCGICLDLLIKPVTLPCGHSFCEACLRNTYQCSVCRFEFDRARDYKVNTILNRILPEILPGYRERLENYERDVEYKELISIYHQSQRCQFNTEIIYNIIGAHGVHYQELLKELESYEQLEVDLNLALLLQNNKIMIVSDYVLINKNENLCQFARHYSDILEPITIIHLLKPIVYRYDQNLHNIVYSKYKISNELTKRCQTVSMFNESVYTFLKNIKSDLDG